MSNDLTLLRQKAAQARLTVLNMVYNAKDGHIPSALSMIEILTVLYYKILRINPQNPRDINRDRFVLSKGHGCASLYAILADLGFFSSDEIDRFSSFDGILGGHPEMQKVPGVEVSTGSLGQGISVALGMAMSAKMLNKDFKVYCVVGDGECNEGSVWEAAQVAAHQKLDNFIVIVDLNKHQSSGKTVDVVNSQNMADKWHSFGWETVEIDGHSFIDIMGSVSLAPFKRGKPSAIIAHTIKGKGISFMEDQKKWHTMIPNQEEYQLAIGEISANLSSDDSDI